MLGGALIERAFARQEVDGFGTRARGDVFAQAGNFTGKLVGAAGRFAVPKGNGRGGAVGILDANAPSLDAANAPGRGAEQEDIARQAFDGEVFIDGADGGAFGLSDDEVVGILGDRAAGCDRCETRAAAAANTAVDLIAVQKRAAAATLGGDAVGEHLDHGVEIRASEMTIGIGAADEGEQVVFAPVAGRGGGDDLLGEDVEGAVRDFGAVELASADGADQGGAFHQLVARSDEDMAFGQRAHPVAGAADTLQGDGDGTRRANLANLVDGADIDAQLE